MKLFDVHVECLSHVYVSAEDDGEAEDVGEEIAEDSLEVTATEIQDASSRQGEGEHTVPFGAPFDADRGDMTVAGILAMLAQRERDRKETAEFRAKQRTLLDTEPQPLQDTE